MERIKRLINSILKDATARSSIKNMLLRPVGMILAILYTPLLINYLGEEANGVWATVLTVITWINYCDLGIGNGLRNLLAKELATEDYESAQQSVSTAYIVLTGISIILLVILLIPTFLLNWNDVLNTKLSVRTMLIITEVFIIINFVLALSNSIFYALQESEKVSLRSCLVQVINIICLIFLSKIEKGNLNHMAILFGTSTAVVYLFNTIDIFRKRKEISPKLHAFRKSKVKSITKVGMQFFIIQLTSVLTISSQNWIVSHIFGAAEVTPVNTVTNAFATIYSICGALLIPMWSKTTDAITRKDYLWVRMTMKRVRYIAMLFIPLLIVIAFLFEDISLIWLGRTLNYQKGVIFTTCLFYILNIENLMFTQFYFGIGDVTPYMWITVIQAIIIIPLSMAFAQLFGVAGVKLASSTMLLISGIALPILLYRKLNQLEAASSLSIEN